MTETLMVILTCWFVWRLVRDPADRGLRVIVAALLAQLLGERVVIAALRAATGNVLTPGMGKLLQNCALAVGFYSVILFFLLSASGTRRADGTQSRVPRRVWWEAGVLVLVCAVIAIALTSTPPEVQEIAYPSSGGLEAAALERGEVRIFYVVAASYFAYAATTSAIWAMRYGCEARPRSRVGLSMAGGGLVLFAIASTGRALYAAARGAGLAIPDGFAIGATALIDIGAALWILGLLAIGVATRWAQGRVWWRHLRVWRDLRWLWDPLHAAFPEDELDHHRAQPSRFGGARARSWWRRAIECRDGLVKLSPWLRDVGYDTNTCAAVQARAVLDALRLREHSHVPSSPAPLLVAAPTTTTTALSVDYDIHQLVQLARAIRDLQQPPKGSPCC